MPDEPPEALEPQAPHPIAKRRAKTLAFHFILLEGFNGIFSKGNFHLLKLAQSQFVEFRDNRESFRFSQEANCFCRCNQSIRDK